MTARPLSELSLDFSMGVIDAEYKKLRLLDPDPRIMTNWPAANPPIEDLGFPREEPTSVRNGSSLEFEQTPKLEFHAGAQYDRTLRDLGSLTLRADWHHRGAIYNDLNNHEVYKQGKRGVLSGRMTWRLPDGQTQLSLWGRNLFDREYLLAGAPSLDGAFGSEPIQYAPPRRFGLEITRRFGE
jgi:outer membrane receptor protein involved in Fe transport